MDQVTSSPEQKWAEGDFRSLECSCLLQGGKVVRPHTNAELLSLLHINSSLLLNTFVILNANSSLKLIKKI